MVLADYSTPTASGGKAFCGFYIKNPPTLEEAGWSKKINFSQSLQKLGL